MSLFITAETLPFGIAFALIIALALIEGLGMLIALSPSSWLDHLMVDVDADVDTGLDRMLGWLHLGRVPSLVLLVLFLAGYALFGYSLQAVVHGLFGIYLPAWIAGLLAVPPGLVTVRSLGALIAQLIPRDETSAVSEQTLIGRTGVISGGAARRGMAGQARVKDSHGRSHYLMVEPDVDDEVFDDGVEVLIVRKVGSFYRCIRNPYPTVL
ncbi:YqiJ family protein [Ideonella sp.]|uniref:YqiJ family protein n=1 Tax=Ideonella sp. TaxID=1929293 RepID=UPI0035AF8E38